MIPELRHRWLPVLLTFALFPNQDRAEVSATVPGAQTFSSLVMTIGDGPDPVSTGVWQRFREVPLAWVLNADGFVRGDGPPDIVGNGGSGLPAVVWAWHTGSDHDIACSEWTGTQWSPATFLTSGLQGRTGPSGVRGDGRHAARHLVVAGRSGSSVRFQPAAEPLLVGSLRGHLARRVGEPAVGCRSPAGHADRL